jgi:hypothetical protein
MCVISSEPDERPDGSEHRAETWRANPVFQLGEVTMTRLGMSSLLPPRWVTCIDVESWIRGSRRRHRDGFRLAGAGYGG